MKKYFFGLLAYALCVAALLAQPVRQVGPVGLTVGDMNAALDFYTKILPFEKISDVEVFGPEYEQLTGIFGLRMRVVRLKLGGESLELTDYLTPGGRSNPADTHSNDRWFQHVALVVSDLDRAYEHLRSYGVQHVSTGPQTIPASNAAAAGVRAFYFRDPDGHNLELIFFPPEKGDPKWQIPSDKLFLGIDHTAIAVSSTEKSRDFYCNLLGLVVKGESHNLGTEQEHLNNVAGAELRISGLRSQAGSEPSGPGVEFLEYLKPRTGRPFPPDARPDDLFHWQTTVRVDDTGAVFERLRREKYALLSPQPVQLADGKLGFKKGFLTRDPVGHALLVVE